MYRNKERGISDRKSSRKKEKQEKNHIRTEKVYTSIQLKKLQRRKKRVIVNMHIYI